MRLSSLFVIAATALGAFPAFAQDAAPAPAPTPASEKKICRSIVPTGSIMGKRICHTKAEWIEFNRMNSDNAQGALSKRQSNQKPGDL